MISSTSQFWNGLISLLFLLSTTNKELRVGSSPSTTTPRLRASAPRTGYEQQERPDLLIGGDNRSLPHPPLPQSSEAAGGAAGFWGGLSLPMACKAPIDQHLVARTGESAAELLGRDRGRLQGTSLLVKDLIFPHVDDQKSEPISSSRNGHGKNRSRLFVRSATDLGIPTYQNDNSETDR